MPYRSPLAAAVLFAATWMAVNPASASPGDLTIVTRDDTFQHAVQLAYVQPFTADTGVTVQQQTWEGGIDALRARSKTPDKDNPWDLVLLDPEELSMACSEGLVEKLDWPAIGGKDHYLPIGVSDCGVGAVVVNTVLAWDKDKLPVTPTWTDFWDVAKYPGKRGLRKDVRGNLEIALLADGVAPGDVYKTLATNDGVDRAFRKLDQLKPYIEWWSNESDPAHILSSGDVLMTSAPSGQIVSAAADQHRGFGVQFTNSLYAVDSWAIMKGAPNLRMAQQFLYFTGAPVIEARLLKGNGESGLAKGLEDGLPPEVIATSPTAPANLNGGLKIDAGFWHDNLGKLKTRFDAWLSH
jgi:putative spermidine/putrescine transport system substrate-binding protein